MIQYIARLEGLHPQYNRKLDHDYIEYKQVGNVDQLHHRSILKQLHAVLFSEHCISVVLCEKHWTPDRLQLDIYDITLHKNRDFTIQAEFDYEDNSLTLSIPTTTEMNHHKLWTIFRHCFKEAMQEFALQNTYQLSHLLEEKSSFVPV